MGCKFTKRKSGRVGVIDTFKSAHYQPLISSKIGRKFRNRRKDSRNSENDSTVKFSDFSTTTATYVKSASETSKITVRLSCDGSTLEIEQCEMTCDVSDMINEGFTICDKVVRSLSVPVLPTFNYCAIEKSKFDSMGLESVRNLSNEDLAKTVRKAPYEYTDYSEYSSKFTTHNMYPRNEASWFFEMDKFISEYSETPTYEKAYVDVHTMPEITESPKNQRSGHGSNIIRIPMELDSHYSISPCRAELSQNNSAFIAVNSDADGNGLSLMALNGQDENDFSKISRFILDNSNDMDFKPVQCGQSNSNEALHSINTGIKTPHSRQSESNKDHENLPNPHKTSENLKDISHVCDFNNCDVENTQRTETKVDKAREWFAQKLEIDQCRIKHDLSGPHTSDSHHRQSKENSCNSPNCEFHPTRFKNRSRHIETSEHCICDIVNLQEYRGTSHTTASDKYRIGCNNRFLANSKSHHRASSIPIGKIPLHQCINENGIFPVGNNSKFPSSECKQLLTRSDKNDSTNDLMVPNELNTNDVCGEENGKLNPRCKFQFLSALSYETESQFQTLGGHYRDNKEIICGDKNGKLHIARSNRNFLSSPDNVNNQRVDDIKEPLNPLPYQSYFTNKQDQADLHLIQTSSHITDSDFDMRILPSRIENSDFSFQNISNTPPDPSDIHHLIKYVGDSRFCPQCEDISSDFQLQKISNESQDKSNVNPKCHLPVVDAKMPPLGKETNTVVSFRKNSKTSEASFYDDFQCETEITGRLCFVDFELCSAVDSGRNCDIETSGLEEFFIDKNHQAETVNDACNYYMCETDKDRTSSSSSGDSKIDTDYCSFDTKENLI